MKDGELQELEQFAGVGACVPGHSDGPKTLHQAAENAD